MDREVFCCVLYTLLVRSYIIAFLLSRILAHFHAITSHEQIKTAERTEEKPRWLFGMQETTYTLRRAQTHLVSSQNCRVLHQIAIQQYAFPGGTYKINRSCCLVRGYACYYIMRLGGGIHYAILICGLLHLLLITGGITPPPPHLFYSQSGHAL